LDVEPSAFNRHTGFGSRLPSRPAGCFHGRTVKARVLVVDDEPLARERVRKLLEQEPAVECIGECADGASAVETIRQQKPDLVFLDVQMPELDGFGVIGEIGGAKMPAVIFVTAHDQFALKAFEVHAVDYLLKPFDRQRFQTALHRALDHLQRRQSGDLNERLGALLASVRPESAAPKYADRFAIKSPGRVMFVKVDDIDWIKAADNYVALHVGAEEHLHRETLAAIETQLAPTKFIRISRSIIVNVDRIQELQPLFHGEYSVILRDGTRLTLSRGYREKLDQLLGKESGK
jgi:two-component system, LytTR family, response regulator